MRYGESRRELFKIGKLMGHSPLYHEFTTSDGRTMNLGRIPMTRKQASF
ncbi:hypothetical protein BRADI_3g51785v3 [Brachypodium distachyon]|uniref:Uncharacterized protein n=1 Tax=Brachypodium distachyon TaxID=15368 RepID=A0A2K2D4N0_BRADI|nr:hypothetical protein BRADI_3g51785v3 [Brachypodium distachyon]